MPETKKEQVLSVRDLDITFKTTAGPVHAIRGVNIDLYKGETVALVGESGSGKSVTMKAAMGILAKNATVNSGSIQFSYHHADGSPETVDLLQKDKKWIRRHINGKRIAMVFQDPMTSLDPTMTIGKQIMEGMLWHFKMPKVEAYKKALELLEEVGITDAEKRMKNYPHQLSGGMRQRVVIAIALSCDPDLLIRTGGECRVSNYLLWQIAYSELYFCDTYWPDFSEDDLKKAIESYQGRQRRFGKTEAQVENEQ